MFVNFMLLLFWFRFRVLHHCMQHVRVQSNSIVYLWVCIQHREIPFIESSFPTKEFLVYTLRLFKVSNCFDYWAVLKIYSRCDKMPRLLWIQLSLSNELCVFWFFLLIVFNFIKSSYLVRTLNSLVYINCKSNVTCFPRGKNFLYGFVSKKFRAS